MVREDAVGNIKLLVADLLIGDVQTSGGNLLAMLLVHTLPVLLLAGFAAVLNHLALLALPQGGKLLRLPPVEHQAVHTLVHQTRLDLSRVCSSHPSVFFNFNFHSSSDSVSTSLSLPISEVNI